MAWQLNFAVNCATPHVEFLDAPKDHPGFGISCNVPFDPSRMPSRGRIQKGWRWSKPIPDLFRTPALNGVSQKFRDLVEKFEPGVHQFFPLKLFKRDGTPVDGSYYIFNCAVGVDAVLFKNAGASWTKAVDGVPIVRTGMRKNFDISRPAIGNHHLWCGKTIAVMNLFVSDNFYTAMKFEKIRGFESLYRRELDEPWIAEQNIQPLLQWEAEQGRGLD